MENNQMINGFAENNECLTPKQFEQIKRTEEFLKEIVNKQK